MRLQVQSLGMKIFFLGGGFTAIRSLGEAAMLLSLLPL